MRHCVQIKVRNLSVSAQNRLQTTQAVLDLTPRLGLRLYKSIERLSVVNTISVEAALGLSLPSTPTNDAVFAEYNTGLAVDNQRIYYDITVVADGHELTLFNRLYVRARKATWDVELSRTPDHWVDLTKAFTIDRLNYDTFVMQKSGIVANWNLPAYEGDYTDPTTGQRPYYWPLLDFGGWCDKTEPAQGSNNPSKVIAVEDFRPLLSLPYILRAGFCAVGWTLNGVIFDTELMKRAWVYALRPDYYIASKRGGRVSGRVLTRYEWTPNASPNPDLVFDELIHGTVGYQIPGGICGVENYVNVSLDYRFYYNGEFHNDRPQPFTAIFVVEEYDIATGQFTGEILSAESVIIQFAANEKKRVIFEQTVTLKFNQAAAINVQVVPNSGFFVEKGGYFETTPENQSLMTEDIVTVADCVDNKTSVFDWLKAAAHLFRLDIETDLVAKTVTLHPRNRADVFGQTVPGFFKKESAAVDISHDVVVGSQIFTPNRQTLKRYTRIEFADSTDAYIGSLNLSEPAHSRTINNGDDLPDEIEQIQNLVFEPTLEGRTIGVIASGAGNRHPFPFLPRLWDNADGQRSFNIAPRILFAYGVCRQINPDPVNETNELTSFFFDARPTPANTGLITDFGYVSQLRTWELTPAPTVDGNFSFNALPVNQSDLFTIFYLGFTQALRNGFTIEVLLKLTINQYQAINFRDLYLLKLAGRTYRVPMLEIKDFDPCDGTPTPVTFAQEPMLTECCDRPCGCQFTKCDYYQDLGEFMQQSTLGNMAIASFKVDDIEQLTTPVSLGNIKIVGIDAFPYVTNLVDALNSIGAPYFTFSYSNRLHPEKGKRFFTIKRPSCFTFRILVTLNGSDCYLYTDTQQLTQFFTPGTWNPLGYGSETFTEPDNCVQTTEY